MNEELPEGWEWTTIDSVATVNPRVAKADIPDNLPISFLPMSAVTEISGNLDLSDTRVAADLKPKSYRGFRDGDVLVAKITPSMENGKAAVARGLVNGLGFGSTEFHVLRPSDRVLADYLFHFVVQDVFRADAAHHMTGTAGQLRVPADYLTSARVPLPPVAEQRRIVCAIEEHLYRLDGGREALEGARRRLDALTASTLDSVCSGPWPEQPLSELVLSLRNGVFVPRPGVDPPGHPIYRISAVRPLVLRTDDIRYADPIPEKAESYVVEAGDLLFTRYSGNPDFVGAAAVVPPAGAGVLHPDKLIRVVVDRTKVLPEWVAAYVAGGAGRREIETRLKTTAGQVGISGTQLKSVPIAVPPIDYQRAALLRLEMVLDERDRLKNAVHAADVHATSLRRSVLAAAFSGHLTSKELAA